LFTQSDVIRIFRIQNIMLNLHIIGSFQAVVDPGFHVGGGTKIILFGKQKLESRKKKIKKIIKIPSKPCISIRNYLQIKKIFDYFSNI